MAMRKNTEEWRPVVGWEGVYSVSSLGRIRRDAPGRGTHKGRIVKGVVMKVGYRGTFLTDANRRTQTYFHSAVAAAFLGPRPVGLEINHLDGDRLNNRVENLEYVTHLANIRHSAFVLGRRPRGSACSWARLTESDIPIIRGRHAAGETTRKLATEYGVSQATVQCICVRKRWKHVQ